MAVSNVFGDPRSEETLRKTYANRRVLVTGHTGFTGSWLVAWLERYGAKVTGYALPPNTKPSLYIDGDLETNITSFYADIRDVDTLKKVFDEQQPEFVFHLAAQPLVLESYENPLDTFEVNVMGTANVLECCRLTPAVRACVVVTSDKCYAPSVSAHSELSPFGGDDPYSASKGAAEIVVDSYRKSFFNSKHACGLASGRAGNVIGGGDWSNNRIVPDWVRAKLSNETLTLRNPHATRPWQHVLDPVFSYLVLGAALHQEPQRFASGWNIGPNSIDGVASVSDLITMLDAAWQKVSPASTPMPVDVAPSALAEAANLSLNTTLIQDLLGLHTVLSLEETADWTASWYASHAKTPANARKLVDAQIAKYCSLAEITFAHDMAHATA